MNSLPTLAYPVHPSRTLRPFRQTFLNRNSNGVDADAIQQVIDALVTAGWLKKVTTETTGRAKHRWLVAG